MASEQLFFSIKTKDAETVARIMDREQNIEMDGINVLEELLVPGRIIFIVLGGDKPAWETGLIGLGVMTRGPYDQGYSKRNFKVQVSMKLLLSHPIKRADLIPFKDTYGTIGIAPITKWEPNQALSQVPREKAIALFRAMLEIEPSVESDLNALIGTEQMKEVKAETTKMVEVSAVFGEDEKDAIVRYMKCVQREVNEVDIGLSETEKMNCLDVQREPRKIEIHPLNCIIYGAPGTGKTYSTAEYALAIIENRPIDQGRKNVEQRKEVMKKYKESIKKGQVVFTTFHQNYGYEEFIQGLRPDTKSERMAFRIVDGVFKRIADAALNDEENNYVIIIDEINRANISKVFGELITLIEGDKRWGEVNETCVTLQSGDVFAVPNNLYIVGTMNSADKSISLIDAALRRRFSFVEQRPDVELVEDATLQSVLRKLNSLLADELESSDLLIGHSYFMNKSLDDLCSILNNSIVPLLYEYFYDNKKKVASVLKEAVDGMDIEIVDDKIGRLRVKRVEG